MKSKLKPAWARRSPGMHILYRFILFLTWLFFKLFYRYRVQVLPLLLEITPLF
jgi:hypothetical protein